MGGLSGILAGVFDDSSTMMLALLVFLATTVLTLGIMLAARARRGQAPSRRHRRAFR
jgi:hypothetical protein